MPRTVGRGGSRDRKGHVLPFEPLCLTFCHMGLLRGHAQGGPCLNFLVIICHIDRGCRLQSNTKPRALISDSAQGWRLEQGQIHVFSAFCCVLACAGLS